MEKKASDFRYNTGETKVPWAAVGENYNAEDLMALIGFMMQGKGPAYERAMSQIQQDVYALDQVASPPGKLSLDARVAKAEADVDKFLGIKGSLFVTNCTAGFEIAYKYAGLVPGDEVIVPAITFIATMAYPLSVGCKLVFADVDPLTLN
ncbi:MAG: DegT/DnrJ/EryC1/StrS family aminotransferase, partial [Oscillospiraceae bacterium]